jgi:hypothetical protein
VRDQSLLRMEVTKDQSAETYTAASEHIETALPLSVQHGDDPASVAAAMQLPVLSQDLTPVSRPSISGTMFPPGLSAPPGTPSHGSTLHSSGNCRPCAWFWKPKGCQNGRECGHCHLCPEGELRERKKNKNAVMRLGLSTPQPTKNVVELATFFPMHEGASSGSDQDSTTCCSSPEQESLAPPSGSDDEEVVASVISHLGLEEESPARHKASQSSLRSPLFPAATEALPMQMHASMEHIAGTCRPCAWFWKPSGCKNATNCTYCHICSEGELKARKKIKHAVMRMGLVTPKTGPISEPEGRYPLKLAACV